jgi:hypothetical protein
MLLLGIWRAHLASKQNRPAPAYAVGVGLWLTAVTIALYLTGVTPAHAMSARYLALSWPFVAIGVGLLLAPRAMQSANSAHPPRWSSVRLATLCAVCVFSLSAGMTAAALQWRDLDWHPGAARADALVRSADHVIIDNIGRGHWPRPVWRLREDAQVFIALPNDLLRRPAPWKKEVVPGTVYISPAKSSEMVRQKLFESFGRDNTIEYVGHLYGIGDVYVLGERKGATPPVKTPAIPKQKPSSRPSSQPSEPNDALGVSGTFSIVAVDPDTGAIGAAVASKYPAVGRVVPYVRAGVGGFITQHWHQPAWGEKALDLLAAGKTPEEVLATLLKDDPQAGKRQLAIINTKGRAAQRHCDDADPSGIWWGGTSGRFYCCQETRSRDAKSSQRWRRRTNRPKARWPIASSPHCSPAIARAATIAAGWPRVSASPSRVSTRSGSNSTSTKVMTR